MVLSAFRLQRPRRCSRSGGRRPRPSRSPSWRRAVWSADPISAISLGLALMFGTAGLPHILMRFFTVPDAKAARKSVFYATGFIGYFYILTFIIGFGADSLLMNDPALQVGKRRWRARLLGGTNMAAIHLAKAVGGACSSASSPRWRSPPSSRWWPG